MERYHCNKRKAIFGYQSCAVLGRLENAGFDFFWAHFEAARWRGRGIKCGFQQ